MKINENEQKTKLLFFAIVMIIIFVTKLSITTFIIFINYY